MDTEHMSDDAAYAKDAARRLRRDLVAKQATIDALVAALEALWEDSLYYHVNAGGAESNHRLADQVNDALALARGGK